MGDRCCPKCGRDFSGDVYWTSTLRRHLARKNPCDRDPSVKFIRNPSAKVSHEAHAITPLDSIVWDGVIPKKSHRDMVPWLFKSLFSVQSNVCFVQPNKSKNQVLVKVSKGSPIRQVTVKEFIRLFVNHVFIKQMYFPLCEKNFLFQNWLALNMINELPWTGACPDGSWYTNKYDVRVKNRPEFMISMKQTVREFLETQMNKTHLKNMLLQM